VLSLLKRYREPLVVIALLFYPGISYLTSGHRGREPNFIDRTVLAIASPVQRAMTWVCDGIGAGFTGYVGLRGVHEENEVLKKENADLRSQLNDMREASAENGRLKKLLDYSQNTVETDVAARVIGINPVRDLLSVRLNRGQDDGVRARMPVVTADGVAGQVQQAVDGWSDAVLITDPSSKIAALVQRSRVRATAVGAGGGKPLALKNVLRIDDVQEGDVVVTAGTDGIFPKGLVLGKVQGVEKSSSGMFLKAELVPAVDLTKLEEVLILPVLSVSYFAPPSAAKENR
jgi:rod shape-determining protein MreC